MRIAALGRSSMLTETVRRLVAKGHQIPLIATCAPTPEHTVGPEEFRKLAAQTGAEYLECQNLNDSEALAALKRSGAELAVSVSWIHRIDRAALNSFAGGILNVHGGELPRYRGNAPIAWAILQGENRIGLTVHLMNEEIDAGPVVLVEHYPLTEATYIGEVYRFLEQRTPELLVQAVTGLESGALVPQAQPADPRSVLRCYPRRPEDGRIDWPGSAIDIARLVRASAEPFGGAFSFREGVRLTIWRARPETWRYPSLAVPGQVIERDPGSGEVRVATGDGVLVLQDVQLGDSDRQAPAAVLRSARDRLSSHR